METQIVYCDETGDDGNNTRSSRAFILTSIYMPSVFWQGNYDKIKTLRQKLKGSFGFHVKQEMHTAKFLSDKGIYRKYNWDANKKKEILNFYVDTIAKMNLSIINVIIDKDNIKDDDYPILKNALKYSIQRVENDSDDWNYLIITDKGRVASMRKIAREMHKFNYIPQKTGGSYNQPIQNHIEDILEKDSKESYFIQLCDFISYFVHLYYKTKCKEGSLPNRVANIVDQEFVLHVMDSIKDAGKFNLKANSNDRYGLVIYPK